MTLTFFQVRPDFPLHLFVRTQGSAYAWRLPSATSVSTWGETVTAHLNRTICSGLPVKKRKKAKGTLVEVVVTTANLMNTAYKITVELVQDFEIKKGRRLGQLT